jgi:molecular chaperone GrpE
MINGDKNAEDADKKHPAQEEDIEFKEEPPAESKINKTDARDSNETSSVPGAEKTAGDEKTISERLAQLEAENADLKDKYLRKYAEFDNFKKRMIREREEASKYSNAMLLLDITGIIDNFERALKSAEDGKGFKHFHSGIAIIEKQLVSILEKKWGLERFSAKGAAFDPERHEAIMAEESAKVETATVVEDLQSGYLLHGRVLRPAKVKVLQPLANVNSQPASGDDKKDK